MGKETFAEYAKTNRPNSSNIHYQFTVWRLHCIVVSLHTQSCKQQNTSDTHFLLHIISFLDLIYFNACKYSLIGKHRQCKRTIEGKSPPIIPNIIQHSPHVGISFCLFLCNCWFIAIPTIQPIGGVCAHSRKLCFSQAQTLLTKTMNKLTKVMTVSFIKIHVYLLYPGF